MNKKVKITNIDRARKNFGFDRYTIVEYNNRKIEVSTIGMFKDSDNKIVTLGSNGRFYETMCFEVPEKPIDKVEMVVFNSDNCLFEQNEDDAANNMHENAVKEISKYIKK